MVANTRIAARTDGMVRGLAGTAAADDLSRCSSRDATCRPRQEITARAADFRYGTIRILGGEKRPRTGTDRRKALYRQRSPEAAVVRWPERR